MPDFDIFTEANRRDMDDLKRMIMECGERIEIPRNGYFVQAGDYCGAVGYICHGSFKCGRTDCRGKERILAFMFEGEFIADYLPARNATPAVIDMRAMEDSVVYRISIADHRDFFEREIEGCVYVRRFIEELAFCHMRKSLSLACESPEERYFGLQARVPDIFSRVNLKDIASYIGVTPETLSRMRTAYLRRNGGGDAKY